MTTPKDKTQDVQAEVIRLLCEEIGAEEESVSLDDSIGNDLGADSLDVLEVSMSVEEAFGITIEDTEVEQTETVRDLVTLVEQKLGKK